MGMKKIGRKQSLIILISIITLVVIIGIIMGTNIIKNNLINGVNYNSSNSSSNNKNLIPEYIKKGVTLGGVTGTLESLDTSDATAKPEDITKGKTAYVNGVKITGTFEPSISGGNEGDISESEFCVWCYADIDNDKTVDGVIYADLAFGGEWDSTWGYYQIPKKSDFKEYYTKFESYSGAFGSNKVIAPVEGSTGNERFYVMSLNDLDNSNYYYWYMNASEDLWDRNFDVSKETNDFGTGKENTKRMIQVWNNEQYGYQNKDIWGLIQSYVGDINNPTWFVPSKSEWAAFRGELALTSATYERYNLNNEYWSSTQGGVGGAYTALFNLDNVMAYYTGLGGAVRLSAIF